MRTALPLAALCAATLLPLAAFAETRPECFSPSKTINLCELATDIQQGLAPSLPMNMSATLRLESVASLGPLVQMTAVYMVDKAGLDARISNAGVTMDQYVQTLRDMSGKLVCGQEANAAFIRLGGELRYVYRLMDANPVATVSVKSCP